MKRYVCRPNYHQSYVANNPDTPSPALLPAPVAGQLDIVCGGPHLADESRKCYYWFNT